MDRDEVLELEFGDLVVWDNAPADIGAVIESGPYVVKIYWADPRQPVSSIRIDCCIMLSRSPTSVHRNFDAVVEASVGMLSAVIRSGKMADWNVYSGLVALNEALKLLMPEKTDENG